MRQGRLRLPLRTEARALLRALEPQPRPRLLRLPRRRGSGPRAHARAALPRVPARAHAATEGEPGPREPAPPLSAGAVEADGNAPRSDRGPAHITLVRQHVTLRSIK